MTETATELQEVKEQLEKQRAQLQRLEDQFERLRKLLEPTVAQAGWGKKGLETPET